MLWFLHADTEVPSDATVQIERALRDSRVAGGYFRIQLPRDHIVYRLTDSFAHYAGRLLRIRCADHGFFCRREAFQQTGGFPDVPLMEDVGFYRAMHRVGRVASIDSRLTVSPRRYEKVGRTKLTLAYGLIALLYATGWRLRSLRKIYDALCLA